MQQDAIRQCILDAYSRAETASGTLLRVFPGGRAPRPAAWDHGFVVTPREFGKGQYVYYHCTGHRGRAATRTSEGELVQKFGEVLQGVRVPKELAGKLATVLRESQTDKEESSSERPCFDCSSNRCCCAQRSIGCTRIA